MKALLLRLHGWLGISAGLVIATVGLTGGLMAFEPQILRLLNPGVLSVVPQPPMLEPAELYRRIAAAEPEHTIKTLTLSGIADRPAQVVFAVPDKPKGRTVQVNPYSGELLPAVRGADAFHWIEDLHRNLLADETGKAVTGFSAFVLIFMALTGFYLRWSRRPRGFSGWFLLRGNLTGRAFLWQLHAVAGTWLFALFLFSAGTGLLWSYDWYKAGIYRVLAVDAPKPPKPDQGQAVSAEQFAAGIAPVWQTFLREAGPYATASIAVGSLTGPVAKVDYIAPEAVHERERNTVKLRADGVESHERFADKPTGEQLTSSWKMLHTGRYWGWSGQLMLLISSLMLPVFAWTGIRLYLTRPKRRD